MWLATWARRRNRGRARAEVATSRYNGGLPSDNDSNDFTSCDPSDTTRPYSTWLRRHARYTNVTLFFSTRQTSRATCFHPRLQSLRDQPGCYSHQAGNLAAAAEVRRSHLDPIRGPYPGPSLDYPLIPDLRIVRLPPHADLELGIGWVVQRLLRCQVSDIHIQYCSKEALTLIGKKIGNQDIMSLLL